jgi:hypothetical protein
MKVDYNKGKVYLIEPIVEHDESEIYIGSTTEDYLSKRFNCHKCMYKSWLNGKTRRISVFNLFNKYGVDNCKITLIENVYANTKDELISREGYYIRKFKCLNKVIPDRSMEEYNKQYYEANKYYHKEYRQINKDDISNYNREYYKTNKDRKLNYIKEYYETNKNKINEKVVCNICNCTVNRGVLKRHYKTIKHINNLISFNNQIDNHIKRMKQIILTTKRIKFVFNK